MLQSMLEGGVFADRVDDALLAASELVTNAVLHGREPVAVHVLLSEVRLRVEVVDASAVSPSFSMSWRRCARLRRLRRPARCRGPLHLIRSSTCPSWSLWQ